MDIYYSGRRRRGGRLSGQLKAASFGKGFLEGLEESRQARRERDKDELERQKEERLAEQAKTTEQRLQTNEAEARIRASGIYPELPSGQRIDPERVASGAIRRMPSTEEYKGWLKKSVEKQAMAQGIPESLAKTYPYEGVPSTRAQEEWTKSKQDYQQNVTKYGQKAMGPLPGKPPLVPTSQLDEERTLREKKAEIAANLGFSSWAEVMDAGGKPAIDARNALLRATGIAGMQADIDIEKKRRMQKEGLEGRVPGAPTYKEMVKEIDEEAEAAKDAISQKYLDQYGEDNLGPGTPGRKAIDAEEAQVDAWARKQKKRVAVQLGSQTFEPYGSQQQEETKGSPFLPTPQEGGGGGSGYVQEWKKRKKGMGQ